jgi:hypothetical protein
VKYAQADQAPVPALDWPRTRHAKGASTTGQKVREGVVVVYV